MKFSKTFYKVFKSFHKFRESFIQFSCWTTFVFMCRPGLGSDSPGNIAANHLQVSREKGFMFLNQGSGLMALGNSSFQLNLTSRVYWMKLDELKLICSLSHIDHSFADLILPRRLYFFVLRPIPRGTYILCWKCLCLVPKIIPEWVNTVLVTI